MGWPALCRDRAHPLFSARTAALPPDPRQGARRLMPNSSFMSCLCKSMLVLWEGHGMNTKNCRFKSSLPPQRHELGLSFLGCCYCYLLYQHRIYRYKGPGPSGHTPVPGDSRDPGPQDWGQVPSPQPQGSLETYLYLNFSCIYLNLKFNWAACMCIC